MTVAILTATVVVDSSETFTMARVHYGGGGDWYSNPSSLPNLMNFVTDNSGIVSNPVQAEVSLSGEELFNYPVVYMNGHGNVQMTPSEVSNLRRYLANGGFLIADDNYDMDQSFRREMGKVFPDKELVLLPVDHEVFSVLFDFPGGMPKIHEHDGEPSQAYAYFHEGRMVCFYSFQSDLGDGWEDPAVHDDPAALRLEALKMGANIIVWTLTH